MVQYATCPLGGLKRLLAAKEAARYRIETENFYKEASEKLVTHRFITLESFHDCAYDPDSNQNTWRGTRH